MYIIFIHYTPTMNILANKFIVFKDVLCLSIRLAKGLTSSIDTNTVVKASFNAITS